MGIASSKSRDSQVADINMTPMIDVLLVLLVIFIVLQMNTQRVFDVQLPVNKGEPDQATITMEIERQSVRVNRRSVPPAALEAFLRATYDNRSDKVIFVKAAPDVPYGEVIRYIDAARAAGVTVVGAVLSGLATSDSLPIVPR